MDFRNQPHNILIIKQMCCVYSNNSPVPCSNFQSDERNELIAIKAFRVNGKSKGGD